ncbi:MAG: GHKL domain-containing protein [Bacilli bacterium]|nr:GHKL domain-containing protein [Bacilli bacterium]
MIFEQPFLWFLNSFELRLIAGLFLFATKMPRRDHFYWRTLIFVPLLFINFFFHLAGIDLLTVLKVGWFSFIFIIEFVAGLGGIAFCYQIDIRRILYVGTGAYSFQNAVNALNFFFIMQFSLYGNPWSILIYFGILIALWCLLYFGVLRQKWFVTSGRMNAFPIITAIITSLGILMVYSSYLTFGTRSTPQIHFNQFIISVFIIGALMLIIRDNVRVTEKEILQRLLIEKEKEYRVTQESIALINQKSHDLKKVLAYLKKHANGELLNEVHTIEESLLKYDSLVQTGNDTVDIVVSEKKLFCLNNDINFSCMVDGQLLNRMSAVDIYTLLTNALDNAIEAVLLIDEPERRNIVFTISRSKGMVQIKLENSFKEKPVFVSGMPITRKSNKHYHGFGVQSMKTTLKKYGGYFDCRVVDDKFVLFGTLPIS